MRPLRSTFSPTFEVKEREDAFVLQADVPGVKETDLDISVNGNVLTVSGSRQATERKEGETYYLYERNYGSFSRSFTISSAVDASRVEAEMNDGVLSIHLPKREEAKPRQIEIKTVQ